MKVEVVLTETDLAQEFTDAFEARDLPEKFGLAGTVNSVMLMLQNEPLLDRKFAARVRLAKEVLGRRVRVSTVTNGAPLTAAAIGQLAASGIDRVSVSIDAVREDTYARIRPGLDFQRVVGNTLSLIGGLGPRRVGVKFLRQRDNEGEEDAFRRFWKGHGVRVAFTEICNRAGWLESYVSLTKRRPDAWKKLVHPIMNRLVPACPLPFTSMNVLWDGRVITCCNDWGPLDTVGDLSRQTLEEIWNGEKLNHYRTLLRSRRTAESLVCAGCSQAVGFWQN
jgi:MoaA/NifB/PqqE/SkfB family radical SAM enzyme